MVNRTNFIKQKIIEQNTTQEALATAMGIDRSTLYRKLKGGVSSLTLGETKIIFEYLNFSNEERSVFLLGQ